MANLEEGFALFDYVQIALPRGQSSGNNWIGQIVEPNRNISTVNNNRLDPTILHGLTLMQSHPDVQSVESVQVFEIKILGEYDGRQLLTPRLRPLPGAIVNRLDATVTSSVIGIPQIERNAVTMELPMSLVNFLMQPTYPCVLISTSSIATLWLVGAQVQVSQTLQLISLIKL